MTPDRTRPQPAHARSGACADLTVVAGADLAVAADFAVAPGADLAVVGADFGVAPGADLTVGAIADLAVAAGLAPGLFSSVAAGTSARLTFSTCSVSTRSP